MFKSFTKIQYQRINVCIWVRPKLTITTTQRPLHKFILRCVEVDTCKSLECKPLEVQLVVCCNSNL